MLFTSGGLALLGKAPRKENVGARHAVPAAPEGPKMLAQRFQRWVSKPNETEPQRGDTVVTAPIRVFQCEEYWDFSTCFGVRL